MTDVGRIGAPEIRPPASISQSPYFPTRTTYETRPRSIVSILLDLFSDAIPADNWLCLFRGGSRRRIGPRFSVRGDFDIHRGLPIPGRAGSTSVRTNPIAYL